MTTSTESRLSGIQRALGDRLVPLAWANLVANIGIVVTGGAVRLTGSGLGCPTWPKCTDESYLPHGELGLHGAIEFGNRLLTYVLVAIAVACWFAARARAAEHPLAVRLSTIIALGIPAQAVLGGITVLTDLNPWIVAGHLLVSMAIVGVCVLLIDHVNGPTRASSPLPVRRLSAALFTVGWAVLYLGTVVTGSGPHSGDLDSRRTGLDPQVMSHVHAWVVYLLVALTLVVLWQSRRLGLLTLFRAARLLLVIELLQGAIGFWQYFTDLPELLVGIHMLGAGATSAGITWVLLATRARR
ncbi:COX15/CtaA family protein [Nocardioides sp. J54]|uniref:COX15/CtaA family protein n=1 Tax=Nocardioides sp. J54 TaxID=935866 RepID=UPI0004AE5E4F|nr:COX15/CtaA family protein [Nocardioides sp. J54]